MTDSSLEHLIALKVPHVAMCKAIMTAHPRSGTFDSVPAISRPIWRCASTTPCTSVASSGFSRLRAGIIVSGSW